VPTSFQCPLPQSIPSLQNFTLIFNTRRITSQSCACHWLQQNLQSVGQHCGLAARDNV
jgi:hypothetical protein